MFVVGAVVAFESLTPPLWYEWVVNSVSIFSWRLWSQLYTLLCKGQPQVVVSCALPLIALSTFTVATIRARSSETVKHVSSKIELCSTIRHAEELRVGRRTACGPCGA